MFTMNRLRGSTPDFCRAYSLAFPPPRYSTRQQSHTALAGARMLEPRASKDQGSCAFCLSSPPGHFEGVTSDISLVLDEWRARVAELHLPEFRNERFPSPREIYNQG